MIPSGFRIHMLFAASSIHTAFFLFPLSVKPSIPHSRFLQIEDLSGYKQEIFWDLQFAPDSFLVLQFDPPFAILLLSNK